MPCAHKSQQLDVPRTWQLSIHYCATAALPAGIAIGGDAYPGSTLSDHCLRYQNIPQVKMIVVLGEIGGEWPRQQRLWHVLSPQLAACRARMGFINTSLSVMGCCSMPGGVAPCVSTALSLARGAHNSFLVS